ncbi:unnamed protein product [Sympodiomycopsis kandeliae]
MVPDSSDLPALAEYYVHHAIPQRFNPGIVVASVLVAFLGAWSTLLLLGKRTSNRGARNIILLLMAALVQSAIGIWSMHFIGMHMTLVPAPGVHWYVRFNPGFTVLSLFVPLVALAIAFFFLDMSVVTAWRACVSGILTGGTIGLMHYSASFHSNFHVSYRPGQTVVSIIMAMLAATVALTLFFQLKSHWDNAWWKRIMCAGVLAVSVAGMHYIGVWGTSYTLRSSQIDNMDPLWDNNNNTTAIAICVMCVFVFFLSVAVAVSDIIVAKAERQAARKVVVCSLTFNKQGHLLVKEDGSLPMIVIETPLRHSEVIDALDKRQPTFQWLYAVSWKWGMVAEYLSAIASRLRPTDGRKSDLKGSRLKGRRMRAFKRLFSNEAGVTSEGKKSSNSTNAQVKLEDFRDRVIDAAHGLATELDIPFEEIGVLYDSILQTGTRKSVKPSKDVSPKTHSKSKKDNPQLDEEASLGDRNSPPPSIFGDDKQEQEGAMLFLVRELNTSSQRETEERYLERGFRMSETRFLAGHLADRYAAQKMEMETILAGLKMYAKRGIRPVVQPHGVYVGLFGVRASTTRFGGLETITYEFARHQIPAYRLPQVDNLTPQIRYFITMLNEMTLEDAMTSCETEARNSSERLKGLSVLRSSREISRNNTSDELDEEDEIREEADGLSSLIFFQNSLFIAMEALQNSLRVYPNLKSTARLSSDIIKIPSSLDDSSQPADMILLRAVLPDAHNASEVDPAHPLISDEAQKTTPFMFTPYSLFTKSQMMLLRGKQASHFEEEVLRDMNRRYPAPSQTFNTIKDYESSLLSFEKATAPLAVSDNARFLEAASSNSPKTDSPQQAFRSLRSLVSFKQSPETGDVELGESNEMHERKPSQIRPLSTIPESPKIGLNAAQFAHRGQHRRPRTPSVASQLSSTETSSAGQHKQVHSVGSLVDVPHGLGSPRSARQSSGSSRRSGVALDGATRRRSATTPNLALRAAEDAELALTTSDESQRSQDTSDIRRFLETRSPLSRPADHLLQSPNQDLTPRVLGRITPDFSTSALPPGTSEPQVNIPTAGSVVGDIDAVAFLSGPHTLPYPFTLKAEATSSSAQRERPQTAPEDAVALPITDGSSTIEMMPDYARMNRPRPSTSAAGDRRNFVPLTLRQAQYPELASAGASTARPRLPNDSSVDTAITARQASDGWVDRHLHAVENLPGGQSLLGVDY